MCTLCSVLRPQQGVQMGMLKSFCQFQLILMFTRARLSPSDNPWPTTWPSLPHSPLARPARVGWCDKYTDTRDGQSDSGSGDLNIIAGAGVRLQSSFQLRQQCVSPSHRRIPLQAVMTPWQLGPGVTWCDQASHCPVCCDIVYYSCVFHQIGCNVRPRLLGC